MPQEFCPRCGTPRLGAFRFCRSCQFDYDGLPASQPVPSVIAPNPFTPPPAPAPASLPQPATGPSTVVAGPGDPSRTLRQIAGIAWLVCAALIAYLGLLQLGYVGTVVDDGSLQITGIWNLVAAAITMFFGARLLTKADRGFLGTSTAWAALTVLWQGYQIANGATHEAYIAATVAALVAGVLSYAARSGMPASSTTPATWATGQPPSDTAQPLPPEGSANGRRGVRPVELLMVLAIGAGVVVAAIVVLPRLGLGGPASAAPTAGAPVTLAPTNRTSDPTLQTVLGEAVPLLDTQGNDLGSATIVAIDTPKVISDLPADFGNKYVAAKVRYDANASWTYTLYDWAIHDGEGRQYNPVGYAPDPAISGDTLAAGRNAEGWVAFEVPDGANDLWIDFVTGGGQVVFTVQVP
jgi:hypothetical protein